MNAYYEINRSKKLTQAEESILANLTGEYGDAEVEANIRYQSEVLRLSPRQSSILMVRFGLGQYAPIQF